MNKMRFREFVDATGLASNPAMLAAGAKAGADQAAPAPETAAKRGNTGADTADQPRMTQLSGAQTIDVRISKVGPEEAYENMLRVCSEILSDEQATVRVWDDSKNDWGQTVRWGELFELSAQNRPSRGYIEIEYLPQQGQGMFGDMGFTMGWLGKKGTNFLRLPFEKMGWVTNPEQVYSAKFLRELRNRTTTSRISGNASILVGLNEWDVTTSRFGRNIIVQPK